MHIRVILCVAFFAVLRGLNMRTRTGGTLNQGCIDNGRLGFLELEAVALDLAANLNRKSIIDTSLDQGVTKPTACGLIRHCAVKIKSTKQHQIQPYLQSTFRLRVRQAMPLADQQALEQNRRLVTTRAQSGPTRTALQDRRKRRPIQQRVNLEKAVINPSSIRRFA